MDSPVTARSAHCSALPVLTVLAAGGLALAACERLESTSAAHVDAFPRLVAVPGARIGDFDDPNVGFSRVGGIDIDRDGNLFIQESAVPEIRVFTPDGVLQRRIGRRGGGPGEFQDPPRFGVVGDTVWAVDNSASRITLFNRDGMLLSTGRVTALAVPLPESYGYLLPWRMRPDGKFISHFGMVASRRDDPPTGVQPTDRIPVPLVLYDASGAVTDTIGWADRPPPRMWRPPAEDENSFQFVQVGDRRLLLPAPPTALPWWEALLDGYLLIETPRPSNEDGVFRVRRIRATGDTVFSREYGYRPVRYTSAELDSIAVRAARGSAGGMLAIEAAGGGGPPPVPENVDVIARALRGSMSFPEYKLLVQNVWVAQDEGIWLRRSDAETGVARWIVLDPQGLPRGELELPPNARVLWNRGDVFWAVVPDEFGVQWVVHFEIRAG